MELEEVQESIKIKALVSFVGQDLLVVVYGGDKPHIGSCVLNECSINLPHHKDQIALNAVKNEIKFKNICLVGGIHINNITPKQITIVLDLCKKIGQKINEFLKAMSF